MEELQSGMSSEMTKEEAEAILRKAIEEMTPPEQVDVAPDLDTEDWYSKLKPDELFNGPDGPAPRLHGLRRLARPYILNEESKVNALIVVPRQVKQTLEHKNGDGSLMSTNEVICNQNFPMASVTFMVQLRDGRIFSDSADAYYLSCNDLGLFPTAVASARAEARALRKVLGIRQHAAEEITEKDPSEELAPDDNGSIKPEQVKLIERMLGQQTDITLKDILTNVTTREVFAVEDLTTGEARKVLRALNETKKKKKPKKDKEEKK